MKADSVGLYIHVPFCVKKCNYCDFCSFSDIGLETRRKYISQMIKEILSYKREEKITVDTIFFGGGTPSLLEPHEISMICDAIEESFKILPECEFSIESNPKTLTREKLEAFIARGLNRVSIGLQSIHANELELLGRIHNYDDFLEAYNLIRDVGITNVGIDLMYGIPEQSLESFKETLKAAVSLCPEHISAYGLILEEGTWLFENRAALNFPSEDEECDMYEFACRFLSNNGYRHYEISNYSKSGFESRHNMKYWKMDDFIGVGVAAYSYFESKRYGNSNIISEYISDNPAQYVNEEERDNGSEAFEFCMLGLRTADGISLTEYQSAFGSDFTVGREKKINDYIKAEYMIRQGDSIALTEKGFYLSNAILSDLL